MKGTNEQTSMKLLNGFVFKWRLISLRKVHLNRSESFFWVSLKHCFNWFIELVEIVYECDVTEKCFHKGNKALEAVPLPHQPSNCSGLHSLYINRLLSAPNARATRKSHGNFNFSFCRDLIQMVTQEIEVHKHGIAWMARVTWGNVQTAQVGTLEL